jgi:hypothetical protein
MAVSSYAMEQARQQAKQQRMLDTAGRLLDHGRYERALDVYRRSGETPAHVAEIISASGFDGLEDVARGLAMSSKDPESEIFYREVEEWLRSRSESKSLTPPYFEGGLETLARIPFRAPSRI